MENRNLEVEKKMKSIQEHVHPHPQDVGDLNSLELSLSLNSYYDQQSKSPILVRPIMSSENPPSALEQIPTEPPRLRTEPEPVPATLVPIDDRVNAPRAKRARRDNSVVKGDTIVPSYPWATDRRAKVHTLQYLLENGLNTISGEVQCKSCDKIFNVEYDVEQKLHKIATLIFKNQDFWHQRAPKEWVNIKSNLPTCRFCGRKESCKPLISPKKRSINWLFLMASELLGCCTLEQLKYFCKHANIHRTGAKNRLLFSTYKGICQQLDPNSPLIQDISY